MCFSRSWEGGREGGRERERETSVATCAGTSTDLTHTLAVAHSHNTAKLATGRDKPFHCISSGVAASTTCRGRKEERERERERVVPDGDR